MKADSNKDINKAVVYHKKLLVTPLEFRKSESTAPKKFYYVIKNCL